MKKILLFIAIMSIYTGTKAAERPNLGDWPITQYDGFDERLSDELHKNDALPDRNAKHIDQYAQDPRMLNVMRESIELFPQLGLDPNIDFFNFLRASSVNNFLRASSVNLKQKAFLLTIKNDLITLFNLILINYRFHVNSINRGGGTFLHYAASFGSLKIMEELIRKGMCVNARTTFLFTPLHEAAKRGKIQAIQLLLNYGANSNLKDNAGNTALHVAANNGQIQAVQLLLAAGADSTIKNGADNTPLEVARDPKIRALLIESTQATNSKRSCSPDAETSSSKRRLLK